MEYQIRENCVLSGLFGGPGVVREVGEKYASSAKHFAGLPIIFYRYLLGSINHNLYINYIYIKKIYLLGSINHKISSKSLIVGIREGFGAKPTDSFITTELL